MSLYTAQHVVNSTLGQVCDCAGCQGDELESDPATWPEWTDEDVWNTTDGEPSADELDYRQWSEYSAAKDHLDHHDRLTLDQLVERQAEFSEQWGNAGGDFLAEQLRELAFKIRMTDAITADEYRCRVDSLDDDARQGWESAGYLNGLAAGRAERNPIEMFGHPA